MSEEFRNPRIINAYIVWSHIMVIDDIDIIYMNKGVHRCTSSWQQCYHAMGQYKNPRYAWELMLGIFQYQDEYGMLPEILTDAAQNFNGVKPPFYGVALEFLQEWTDFSFVPRKELLRLYIGLSEYVYWWLTYRDTDQDGVASYDSADESGWDDPSSRMACRRPLRTWRLIWSWLWSIWQRSRPVLASTMKSVNGSAGRLR